MITTKYKGLLDDIAIIFKSTPSELEFIKFLREFKNLEIAALAASETLDEVRTGEDFECICWDKAREIRKALGVKGEFDDEE